jgi:hypothetical protein
MTEAVAGKKLRNDGSRRVFTSRQEDPRVTREGIGDDEVAAVVIVGLDNASSLLVFDVGIGAGAHEAKIKVESGAREEVIVQRVRTEVGLARAGIETDLAGVERMNIAMKSNRETSGASL